MDVVLFGKKLSPFQGRAIVEDVERGFVDAIKPVPWQTDTCIGNWHYSRRLYQENGYKTPKEVIQRLADVVSKNGNLLLNIPVRGDGTIDEKEVAILDRITTWTQRNGRAIFGTRPWRRFGEGPTRPPVGMLNEDQAKPFTAGDIRFTRKGRSLYAILLDLPTGETAIKSLGSQALPDAVIEHVQVLGGPAVRFTRDGDALRLTIPRSGDDEFVPALRIEGRGLV
jgi:alpha-L-fucosidase